MFRLLFGLTMLWGVFSLMTPRRVRGVDKFIVLASTTSVENSGLLNHLLPLFEARTGIEVRVVALGSGHALDLARSGDADLVLVHDPEAEARFMAEGHGFKRREIAWNDFIIVGRKDDPAKIAGEGDAVAAFKAIWRAQSGFVARSDKSGTDALEKRLWQAAGLDIDEAGPWYKEVDAGMEAALQRAVSLDAYTLTDRGTWLSFADRGDLIVMVEGDPRLVNRYDLIELDPQRHREAKRDLARQLADWLVSRDGQKAIGDYKVAGERLFHPEADPKPREKAEISR